MQNIVEPDKNYPFWLRFRTWFFGLTFFYFVLAQSGIAFLLGVPTDSETGGIPGHMGTIVGNFIGLFVPIGPSNIFFIFFPGGLVAIALILWALVSVERKLHRLPHEKPWGKILINLFILFFLTLVTDFLTFGRWASLDVLLGNQTIL